MKHALIFPGQGAQAPGMGRDFYENFAKARELFEAADEILKRRLSAIVFEGSKETLTQTRNSQIAIYVVSMAIEAVFREQFPDTIVTACSGLSLGEYSALTASGRLSFEQCLPLVQIRADAMNAACEATAGGMAAIIGLDSDAVEAMVFELQLPNDLWIANLNCPGQVVLSGTQKGIQAGIAAAKARGAKRALPLQVHGAFHSGLMRAAEEQLMARLCEIELSDSNVGLAMNVTGRFEWDAEGIRRYLGQQVTQTVRWEACVRTLVAEGAGMLLELGPGKTLAGLNKRMGLAIPTCSIETVGDLDRYSELVETESAGV